MTSDLPSVVFRASPRSRLIAAALGSVLTISGLFMIMDQGGTLLGYAFSPRLRASQAGWLVAGLGVIVFGAGLLGYLRGCPTLELGADGIIYTRCLQGVTRIAWSDFDHVEIKRTTAPSTSGRDIELEGVIVTTTDGRRIGIAPIAPADELHGAIERAAARYKTSEVPT